MIGKPRRRRVWDNPPEKRKSWKKSKRSDLKKGQFKRHIASRVKKRLERKKG